MENQAENIIEIDSPLGMLRLRPERDEDDDFRFQLFCQSCPTEFALLRLEPAALGQLIGFQFRAQTAGYRANFPDARFDIIELASLRIGRIVVDRRRDVLHIVDQAIVPSQRNRGAGTTIMKALMDEAGRAGQMVRLRVASTNHSAMRLYLRIGFAPIATDPLSIEMEWRAPADSTSNFPR
jgi:ribosomal protein S18 acetylase RimI-like enzyme